MLSADAGFMLIAGVLQDTSNFYTAIYYIPAASLFPNIITYDKTGKIMDGQNMDFECWDGAPYNYQCEGAVTINEKLEITFEHTTTCFDCDSLSTATTVFIDKGRGKISTAGQIEFSRDKTITHSR